MKAGDHAGTFTIAAQFRLQPHADLGVKTACELLKVALGEALRPKRLRPELVGLGDLDLADYVVPALTSARIPGYRMGRIAADMIVRRLQGEILKRRQST